MEATLVVLIVQALYILIAGEEVPAVEECRFSHDSEGNVLAPATPIAVLDDVRSSADCARRCLGNFRSPCSSYGYSQEEKQCLLFDVIHAKSHDPGHQGFKYYAGCPGPEPFTGTVGETCGGGDICTVVNSECRDGKCQCVIGYHFYPGPGTCVETCPNGYSDNFYVVKGWTLSQNNDRSWEESMDAEDCLNKCRVEPLCSSVDHNPWWCHWTAKNMPELPHSAWKLSSSGSNDYYQRDCA